MTPLLSIIVPVFNTQRYLKVCIESVINQSYSNLELILVDDGSTDGSGLICDDFAVLDSRIKVIHQKKQGVSAARNTGMTQAKGEIVSFVDSDDWIESDYCEQIIDGIEGVDEVIFPIKTHYSNGVSSLILPPTGVFQGREKVESLLSVLHNDQTGDVFGWTANKAHRRNVIDSSQARFPEGLCYFEDEVFSLQYYKRVTSLRIIAAPIYNYRFVDNSLTNRNHSSLTYSTVARLLLTNIAGYENEQFLSSFIRQIYVFMQKAESTENNKRERANRMIELKEFYHSYQKILNVILSRKRKLLYSIPDPFSRCLFFVFRALGKM